MLNVASSGVIWNEIFTPEAKLPKKPFSPQAKVTKKAMLKPCNNQTKPQPYPTLPQYHKIFTPGPNLLKKGPTPPILILK